MTENDPGSGAGEKVPTRAEVPTSDARVQRAIELATLEAELLDAKAYHAWKALYADDGIYVIPIDREAEQFDDVLNMVYDDRRMRDLRVTRMTEGYSMASVDAATTARTVGRFVPAAVTDDTVELRFAQILVAYKRGNHDLWAGDVEYVVRLGATAADDRVVRKIVRLVDSDDAVLAAGFLL